MNQWLMTVLILVGGVAKASADSAAGAQMPFEYREGLLWIEVQTPHSEKRLNFLFDTGAGVSVLSRDTAMRLGLKLGKKVQVSGVGTTLIGRWSQRLLAKVGNVTLPRDYLAVDLDPLSRSCERPVDGLIGADFFRGRIVQIDFAARKIRLLRSEQRMPLACGNSLRLEIRPCGMRVPIAVDGHPPQWVRLDTGCATPMQWVTSDVDTNQCTRQIAIGLAKISIPQIKTTVCVGRTRFRDVPTGVHCTSIFPGEAGLLGNGLLSRFSSVTIDAKSRRVIFEPATMAQ